MTNFEVEALSKGRIGLFQRAMRAGIGLAIIMAALHVSVSDAIAYPYIMLFTTLVVFTGIVGWDPLYAVSRSMVSSMKHIEFNTFSKGNISVPDRVMRVALGSAILVYSLEVEIGGAEAYPFIKMFASLIVLTGIAGWDPLYAMFRSQYLRLKQPKGRYQWLTTRYS